LSSAALKALGVVLLVTGLSAARAEKLFVLEDVRGDDNGAGVLIYPNRDDLKPGDLDLVRLSAEQRSDGIWFKAEMAQPVRSPVGQVMDVGQTPMERVARHDFYAFNIDIYIDTDRVAGVGRQDTVPGRGVAVDRNFAWEKCIVLTPRPDIAQTMLQMYFDDEFEAELRARKGKVDKPEIEALQQQSEARVRDLYLFPTKIRVSGRTVEFLVPTEFLGGVPTQSWAYTVLVTGADLEQVARIGLTGKVKPTMMTMSVGRGIRRSQWGIRSDVDEGTPPVVDLLAADEDTQYNALMDYDLVAGRMVAVPGIAPDGRAAVAPTGVALTMDQAARLDAAGDARAPAGDTEGQGTAAPGTAERRTVPARLRTLNELLQEGLITQVEYDELRRKILTEL
jgi:hypothetical protein